MNINNNLDVFRLSTTTVEPKHCNIYNYKKSM